MPAENQAPRSIDEVVDQALQSIKLALHAYQSSVAPAEPAPMRSRDDGNVYHLDANRHPTLNAPARAVRSEVQMINTRLNALDELQNELRHVDRENQLLRIELMRCQNALHQSLRSEDESLRAQRDAQARFCRELEEAAAAESRARRQAEEMAAREAEACRRMEERAMRAEKLASALARENSANASSRRARLEREQKPWWRKLLGS